MIRKYFFVFAYLLLVFLVFSTIYLYLAYQDYTCHNCMTMPSLKSASEEKALIAIYTSNQTNTNDTIYLTQANRYGYSYSYYSDEYFVCSNKKLNTKVSKIKTSSFERSVSNGVISYSGINNIPKQINCLDSTETIVNSFFLDKIYPNNIKSGKKKSYFKKWKMILEEF